MSKFKKFVVCCTAILLLLPCLYISVSAATNMPYQQLSVNEVGVLPDNYELINFRFMDAIWFDAYGNGLGNPRISKVSEGVYSFQDEFYNYDSQLVELRIYLEVPLDYVDIPYNYYFQVYSNQFIDFKTTPNTSRQSQIKYSYATDYQETYSLTYFDTPFRQDDDELYEGYIADNKGIVLKRASIRISCFFDINGFTENDILSVQMLLGGAEYSRNDPSSPGYVKPNSDKFNDLEKAENELVGSTSDKANEYNQLINDSFSGSLQRFHSAFSAVSLMFSDFLLSYDGVDLMALIYISLALGIVPLIVGLTINGLRERDRVSMRERMSNTFRQGYRAGVNSTKSKR